MCELATAERSGDVNPGRADRREAPPGDIMPARKHPGGCAVSSGKERHPCCAAAPGPRSSPGCGVDFNIFNLRWRFRAVFLLTSVVVVRPLPVVLLPPLLGFFTGSNAFKIPRSAFFPRIRTFSGKPLLRLAETRPGEPKTRGGPMQVRPPAYAKIIHFPPESK